LLYQPGTATGGCVSTTGYSADNFGDAGAGENLILSDEALVPIDGYAGCAVAGFANYTGPARPSEALSAFDGETKEGTWRITVVDATGTDTGTLTDWSLHFNNTASVPKGPTGHPVINAGVADGTHTGDPAPKLDISTTNYSFVAGPVADTWEITIDLSAEALVLDKNKKNWLAISAEHDANIGLVGWMFSQTSNANDAQQYNGAILEGWSITGTDLAFSIAGTKVTGAGCPGGSVLECGDIAPANGITDDVCTWYQCGRGVCIGNPNKPCDTNSDCTTAGGTCVMNPPDLCGSFAKAVPSDMGAFGGNCEPDSFCNNFDRAIALNCFSNATSCDKLNIDAGRQFGGCAPDGFCNLFDANHATACFAGTNPCNCGPEPDFDVVPNLAGATGLTLEAANRAVRPGATFTVQAYINDPQVAMSGYQLHTTVSGGRSGMLELVDVSIADRADHVFDSASGVFDAFNVENAQMLAGIDGDGAVKTAGKGYLATFTYRVSSDAAGAFVIDFLYNEAAGDQTFLVGATDTDKIEITGTTPAVVVVTSGASRSIR
jgi:hypothetical protein